MRPIPLLASAVVTATGGGRLGIVEAMTPTTTAPMRPAPTVRELEASLEAYFQKQVRLLGGRCVKMAPTEKGCPDRLVLLPGGRMYLCELKALDGRVSAAQALFHERVGELGTRVHLLVGRHGVDRWLRAQGADLDGEPATRAMPRHKNR